MAFTGYGTGDIISVNRADFSFCFDNSTEIIQQRSDCHFPENELDPLVSLIKIARQVNPLMESINYLYHILSVGTVITCLIVSFVNGELFLTPFQYFIVSLKTFLTKF